MQTKKLEITWVPLVAGRTIALAPATLSFATDMDFK